MSFRLAVAITLGMLFVGGILWMRPSSSQTQTIPPGRSEVVFWHFWGGTDRDVVDDVVARFNEAQNEYFVRAIAMPGNNLQAKLFLAVAGGDPPDLVNQDDPVLADWGQRGVIHAIDEIAPPAEVASMRKWMLEPAEKLSVYQDRMYGICNGLDIRALYYNQTALEQFGLQPPTTIEELDEIARTIAPEGDAPSARKRYGYLPDSRRLWAWGYVFGADFYDPNTQQALVDSPQVHQALRWMTGYADRYGADNIAAFRTGDQSLPNKAFPLLPVGEDQQIGRYTVLMDGQWRVREIKAFQETRREQGLPVPKFGACPLPVPSDNTKARRNAGWVNGNFFVVPRGAKNTNGAWAFAKFWIGYTDAAQASKTCAAGGWIPVADKVIQTPTFQEYLQLNPLFKTFVDLAASPHQYPIPQVIGASMFRRTVESAAYEAMYQRDQSLAEILKDADTRVDQQLERFRGLSAAADHSNVTSGSSDVP